MSVTNFIPQIWSARLLANLDKRLVFAGLTNRDYEGEIRQAGDTVKINKLNNLTVSDYAGTVNYQSVTSTQVTLTVDQQKYVAYKVDDVDRVQANVDLVDRYQARAAVALADVVDQYIASLYPAAGAGTVSLDLTVTSPDVYGAFVEARKLLNKKNVPMEGRWAVVSPEIEAALLNDAKFVQATDQGDRVRRTGEIGGIAGFTIYVSNNVPEVVDTTVTPSQTFHKVLFGTNDAIAFAQQIVETEAMRDPGSFADLVRSLLVFGAAVIEPDALGVMDVRVA